MQKNLLTTTFQCHNWLHWLLPAVSRPFHTSLHFFHLQGSLCHIAAEVNLFRGIHYAKKWTYRNNFFDESFVGANFSFLQRGNAWSNPCDEGKLGSPAHFVSSLKSCIAIDTFIIYTYIGVGKKKYQFVATFYSSHLLVVLKIPNSLILQHQISYSFHHSQQ